MEQNIRISVRNLVEFILRSGDIDNRRGTMADKEAMQMGSRLHRKIQGKMGAAYQAEVFLTTTYPCGEFSITVEGRADGIIQEEDGVTIDEIKGIFRSLEFLTEPVPVHLAQAKCYAYIYALGHELERICVQMTYANLETEEIKRFREEFAFSELEEWFGGVRRFHFLIGRGKKIWRLPFTVPLPEKRSCLSRRPPGWERRSPPSFRR